MLDFTNKLDHRSQPKKVKIMSATFLLEKQDILNALGADTIYVHGDYFKVPKQQLISILTNKRFGIVTLELEQKI